MKFSKEGQCKGRKIPGCMGIARFRVSIAYHPGWGSYNSGSIKEIPEHAALLGGRAAEDSRRATDELCERRCARRRPCGS